LKSRGQRGKGRAAGSYWTLDDPQKTVVVELPQDLEGKSREIGQARDSSVIAIGFDEEGPISRLPGAMKVLAVG